MKGAIVTVRNFLSFVGKTQFCAPRKVYTIIILRNVSGLSPIQLPQDRYPVIEALLKRICELEKESAARESFRARLDKKRPDGQLRAHRAAMLSLSRRSALLRFRHPQIDQDTYGAEG
jgi:hypothetical protein